jgi:hypothetical protein
MCGGSLLIAITPGCRTLGVGVLYAIVVSIFSGVSQRFGLLFKQSEREHDFYWFVTIGILLSLLVNVFVLPETRTEQQEKT